MILIHCSTLPGYNDCPRRAAPRICWDLIKDSGVPFTPERPKIYTAVGNGCHLGAAAMARRKMTASPMLNEGQSVAIAKMHEDAKIGVEFDDVTTNITVAEKQVLRMVASFHADVLPALAPREIELKRQVRISDDFGLIGTYDLDTTEDDLFDWKFGSVWRSCRAQLGGYSIMRRAHCNTVSRKLWGCHVPRVAIRKPQPAPDMVTYDVDGAEKLATEVIQTIMRDIRAFQKSGNPACFPANPMSNICSPKYCRSYGTAWCKAI
jgi:hypothetical protein